MAQITLDNHKILGDYLKPYIVAEVNSSHNGDVNTAKKMVMSAKECGCDCVKFQSWSAESLYSKTYYEQNPVAKRIIQKFSFSEEKLFEIAQYCNEIEIDFSSTPYSEPEVDFLVHECDVPFIKIASMEINNYDYLHYIANKNKPVVLSTGMADMSEIEKAIQIFENVGNTKIVLLHCVSIYPAQPSIINLNNIHGFREAFPKYPIGFSDHTLGSEIASASIAMGACLIEKHFTLDNTKMGMDNNMATEPEKMKELVRYCHNVYDAMGTQTRVISQQEQEQRQKMRRSVIATHDLAKGTVLEKAHLSLKRPGTGFSAENLHELIGRSLCKTIEKDALITELDFI